jgi:hypothetical protein
MIHARGGGVNGGERFQINIKYWLAYPIKALPGAETVFYWRIPQKTLK